MTFRRRRRNRIALAAIAAIKFHLSEQCGDFWLAVGGKEESTGRAHTPACALLDELGAALTEPAGQLHARIVVGAQKTEATIRRPF